MVDEGAHRDQTDAGGAPSIAAWSVVRRLGSDVACLREKKQKSIMSAVVAVCAACVVRFIAVVLRFVLKVE